MFKVNLVYIMTSKPCGDTQQDQVKEGREEVKEGGKKRRQQSDISVTQSPFKMLTERETCQLFQVQRQNKCIFLSKNLRYFTSTRYNVQEI